MDPDKRDVSAEVTLARKRLRDARSMLDLAVGAMPDVAGEETMATPALLALLIGAVRAKEHLDKVEGLLPGQLAEA
jgi:hypothetical protein